jgi:hypothetical protein
MGLTKRCAVLLARAASQRGHSTGATASWTNGDRSTPSWLVMHGCGTLPAAVTAHFFDWVPLIAGTGFSAFSEGSILHGCHTRRTAAQMRCTSLLFHRAFASGGIPPHTVMEMPALSPTMSQVCATSVSLLEHALAHPNTHSSPLQS